MPYPSPETSTSTIPLSCTSVSIPHNAYFPTSPYPASNTALDNTLPTGPSLSSHALMTRSAPSPPCLESHRSITAAPNISLERTSDGDGSPKPGLHKEKDAFDPPSANRAIYTTPDLPPHSRSLQSVTDSGVAAGDRSLRGPSAERIGDHYPHPSHCRYDIV
ncbi:hypothetical protein EDB83DRAFT_2355979 [Lactarius deliciosus]|nr:hypothetical protein EDB83DRAFT_2355979 [Lactarius deliciosus]